mgnify:CR=1 FL=1
MRGTLVCTAGGVTIEHSFREILDNLRDGVAIVEYESIVFVNSRLCEIFGYPKDELLALDPLAPVVEEERHRIEEVLAEMHRTGLPPRELEYWIWKKSGERCCINNRYTPRIVNGVMTGCIIVTTDVTERRRAEESLKQSERLFRSIVESSPVPMVVTRAATGDILYASRQFGRFLGWAPGSIVGRNCSEFYQDASDCETLRTAILEKDLIEGYEVQLRDVDGRPFWSAASLRRLQVGGENVILGGYMDIDERKIEEDLVRVQNEFATGFGDLRSLQATFQHILEAALAMSGLDRGLLASCSSDGIHPNIICSLGLEETCLDKFIDNPPLPLCNTKHCAPKFTLVEELDKKGSFFQCVGFATACMLPVPLGDGSSGCLILGSVDERTIPSITKKRLCHFASRLGSFIARARAEEALRDSEARHRTLLDTIPDTILRISHEGTFLDCHEPPSSKLFQRLNGIVGKAIYEVLSPRLAEHFTVAIENVFDKDTIEVFEEVWDQQDEVVWVEVRLTQISKNEVQAIVRDVTDRHRAEDERQELERRMQQKQRIESLGVLAGGIAHDFNNLLQSIMGNVSLARMEAGGNQELIESLEQIEEATRSAASLTKQMLAYGGKGRFLVRPLSLSKIVKSMFSLIEASVAKRAKLAYELADDLPLVEGDNHQLSQIVMNLVTNGAEAHKDPKGSITITTKVIHLTEEDLADFVQHSPLQEDDYILLEVKDEGEGMSGETLERAFEPFFSTKFTGRGLGLAAVHGAVRGHGGAISINSEIGKGTLVRVLFPICRTEEVKELKPKKQSAQEWKSTGTILVVDDDKSIRLVAKRILEGVGFEVLSANDGTEGIEIFEKRHKDISLVILDMTMPNMDGYETFERLNNVNDTVPVLLVSGYDEQETIRKFDGAGLAGFIQKPFDRTRLLNEVKAVLSPDDSPN